MSFFTQLRNHRLSLERHSSWQTDSTLRLYTARTDTGMSHTGTLHLWTWKNYADFRHYSLLTANIKCTSVRDRHCTQVQKQKVDESRYEKGGGWHIFTGAGVSKSTYCLMGKRQVCASSSTFSASLEHVESGTNLWSVSSEGKKHLVALLPGRRDRSRNKRRLRVVTSSLQVLQDRFQIVALFWRGRVTSKLENFQISRHNL